MPRINLRTLANFTFINGRDRETVKDKIDSLKLSQLNRRVANSENLLKKALFFFVALSELCNYYMRCEYSYIQYNLYVFNQIPFQIQQTIYFEENYIN